MTRRRWELVDTRSMLCETFYPAWGVRTIRPVTVDTYRKQKRNGLYQYKNVKRS